MPEYSYLAQRRGGGGTQHHNQNQTTQTKFSSYFLIFHRSALINITFVVLFLFILINSYFSGFNSISSLSFILTVQNLLVFEAWRETGLHLFVKCSFCNSFERSLLDLMSQYQLEFSFKKKKQNFLLNLFLQLSSSSPFPTIADSCFLPFLLRCICYGSSLSNPQLSLILFFNLIF